MATRGRPKKNKATSDGTTAEYYQLPLGATELQDIISAQNMNSQMGEVGRAWKRYGLDHHSSRVRELNKIIYYANAEKKRLADYEGETE